MLLELAEDLQEELQRDLLGAREVLGLDRAGGGVGGELDEEVRSKIKNLEEGTASFEIEYQRIMGDLKRKKGLV